MIISDVKASPPNAVISITREGSWPNAVLVQNVILENSMPKGFWFRSATFGSRRLLVQAHHKSVLHLKSPSPSSGKSRTYTDSAPQIGSYKAARHRDALTP
jgi:hypothetical protein